MSRKGFHTITLGCKLNQFDGAAIEGELARRGLAPEADPSQAGVVVINTCTVTHRADSDARKIARRIRRQNPDCRLLVTGCYAERDRDALLAVGGIDRVFGNRDKPNLGGILDELGIHGSQDRAEAIPYSEIGTAESAADRGCDGFSELPEAVHFGQRSRAFLKVQDGCRLACSYCIIPTVRGPSRSVLPDQLVEAAAALFRQGYSEIVLTGVNTGDYGRDIEPRIDLATLLRRLLELPGTGRFRLNSLEPLTVTDEIIELMATHPRICPHLQIPLQSGSPTILRAMRRNYRLEHYAERLAALRQAIPHIGLGADVIVGFPGETDELFEETVEFIRQSPLNYLHVFSWSARAGTPAATLEGRVPEASTTERSRRLRELAAAKTQDFCRRWIGVPMEAVVLGEARARPGATDGEIRALTGNYIEVRLPCPTDERPRSGARIQVRPESVAGETVLASAIG